MTGKINPALIDVTIPDITGYPEEFELEDTRDVLMCAVRDLAGLDPRIKATDFPKEMWIERKDWLEVQKLGEKNRTRAIDFLDRFTNQSPTHECTCHAATSAQAAIRNRSRRIALGPPVAHQQLPISAQSASVWLSPLSVYAEANPRKWGGANVRQVLEIMLKRGILPDKKQPRDWGFKHTLTGTNGKGNECQSSGDWVRLSKFPEGWRETSKHFRPLEVIFPENFEQLVCLLLGGPEAMGLPVVVGGRGHSIPYMFVDVEEQVIGYPDSYDVIRYDSFRNYRSGGMYAPVSCTLPDDWNKPAG
jgi:hypothetical protein